jgi:hypothetical protein
MRATRLPTRLLREAATREWYETTPRANLTPKPKSKPSPEPKPKPKP